LRTLRWSLPLAVAAAAAVAVPATAAAASSVRVSAKPVTTSLSTKATKTTVTVKNAGKRRLSGLSLSVTPPKSVKITLAGAKRRKLSRALKPLKAGQTRRVGVSLRRTSKGPEQGRLVIKVKRKGKTLAKARLSFGAAAPTQPANPNSLAGRYFWGSLYTINGIEQNTLYFTGPDLIYIAATESGWPSCTAVSDTCKPYSYDAETNQLTIDSKPATLEGRKLTFDEDTYAEFGFPPAGSRWDTYVTYANSSGICPLYCNYYRENLAFRPDGTFIRDAVASGTGPIVDWGVVPPDSKGTYEVRADHTLRLAYADGTERIETVALYFNDDGTLMAPGDGLVLGGDGYFDIRD
jgi:hypothetical protein